MNKLTADDFRSLVDSLLRSCNYDLNQCSNSFEATRCYAGIARKRAELVEAEPVRRTAALAETKASALARSAELLLVHEDRISQCGKSRGKFALPAAFLRK